MSIIYEPKGRAKEYADLAANLYAGCSHGCLYCYAPNAVHRGRPDFHNGVKPRADILRLFQKDCERLQGTGAQVLLSFTTDPYQPLDVKEQLTRKAIELLHANGLYVEVLTKGGMRAARDFDLLGAGDAFATTPTFLDEKKSRRWEPAAALPDERIAAVREAHRWGIETWVSLEPVIEPEQTLQIIRETHAFVDLYKVGKLNYHAAGKVIDWRRFGQEAVALLDKLGKSYYIKQDLQAFIEASKRKAS